MATTKLKSKFLVVRVTDKTRTKFHNKAQRYGNPSDVLREIVEASGLYELGPVNVPAYGSATSAVVAQRSYAAWLAAQSEQLEQDPAAEPETKKAVRSLVRDAATAMSLRLRNV